MTGDDIVALVVAICLVPLGGLLACVDSALGRVSVARVEEFLREDRKGARALSLIVADRARYTNLLLMLRMSCNWDDNGNGIHDHGDWAEARLVGRAQP